MEGTTFEQFTLLVKGMKSIYTSENFLPDRYSVEMWHTLLKEIPYEMLAQAVKEYMLTEKFPPTPADIIQRVRKTVVKELNEEEAWALVRKAICNGNYHAQEEYDKLPKIVQKAVGSPDNIRNWAQTDLRSLDTVIASNFARVYKSELEQSAKTISNQLALGQMSNLQIEG